ncbi:hypothetical protein M2C28_28550, partial [Klebsiella pneumoniae]|nr:hypothetical protein [Klebsiella pneumoniae]MDZ0379966.1 hypothetical protein [Klebsiella pneumoniae]MDZ0570426.1 hypothetical protein [Klebsiella pneumoniae]MDZ0603128.1 hypothetical protein [Klebsiella pneumoniae]MDZ3060747.1 hypothetical protein [Klebsiella pneumoniae]
ITPSVAEQEGQQTETEATGAPQKHHYTLNQQVGSITQFSQGCQFVLFCHCLWFLVREVLIKLLIIKTLNRCPAMGI